MKKLIYILLILSSCTTSKFLSIDQFDKPVYYERNFDDSVTAVYLPNLDNIWYDENGGFTLFANDSIASRLVTEEKFNVGLPFTITFEIKATPADLALYAVWFYPCDDQGGFLVAEPDAVEITDTLMVFSLHRDENGYGGHWFTQKFHDVNVRQWHKIKMKVTEFDVTWWCDGVKINKVKKDMPQIPYYLRISIIMSKNHRSKFKNDARMDVRNIKIAQWDF